MNKVLFFTLLFFGISFKAAAIYDVNENCKEAWVLLMDLKIDQAKDLLAKEISKNPKNYYAYYLDQTCDSYQLIINSSEEDYENFQENYQAKREIMDDQDTDSPYYLSCLSEMEIQIGIFNIINGDHFSGIRKVYSCYKDTYRNLKKHPGFQASLKLDGFFNVALSNLPPFIKRAVSFFGVSSNPEYGFKTLTQNYKSQKNIKGFNAEAALYIILTAKINKTPEMVYEFTQTLDTNISNLFILKYFKANIAYRTGKNEEALKVLQQINVKRYLSAHIIYNYLMGKVLLRKLDSHADVYLLQYVANLEKPEYLKEMNYNLAIFHLIKGEKQKYLDYCEIVREQGVDINERDREALYDANLDYIPNIDIVKSRLLIDGGYNLKAKLILNTFDLNKDLALGNELEYYLLKGRLNDTEMDTEMDTDTAIDNYKKVISLGSDEDYSFACQAALLLGNIYEEQGTDKTAKEYYKLSLKLNQKEFYEYLEDKASKALKRLDL